MQKGCFFLSLFFCNFDEQLSKNFHRFVTLCICWGSPNEKTGLWKLPKVSRVFKHASGIKNIYFGFTHTQMCVCTVYSVLSRVLWFFSQDSTVPRSPFWLAIGSCVNAASPKMCTLLKNTQWHCPLIWRMQDYSDRDVRWIGSIQCLLTSVKG